MYRLFDGVIACEFPLSGIPVVASTAADIQVRLGSGSPDEAGYEWFHGWREADDELILACARRPTECGAPQYLLRFPGLADFEIQDDTAICYPHPQCREDSLRHLLVDQVIPRIWANKGHLVVHASAVQLANGRVIAFTGESGWGKSTLAGAMAEQGNRLLSDDSICLRACEKGVQLIPSYTGLRLNEDSIAELGMAERDWNSVSHYSDKQRLESGTGLSDALLWLSTLYLMEEPADGAELSIRSVSGADLVPTLIKRSFLLDIRDKHCAVRQMREASAVLRAVPKVCTLAYPRNYQQLPAFCESLSQEKNQ